MHDGIHVDKAGTPTVTICTDAFTETSKAMAAMWGAPDYPVVITPHPIARLTKAQLEERCDRIIDQVVSILTGVDTGRVE